MKKYVWTLAAALLSVSALGFSFDDIQLWSGEGSHRAALVIQWNDGGTATSLAWGFRFEGTENTETLLTFSVFSDPRLYLYGGPNGLHGLPVYGLGYDANATGVTGDGFTNAGSTPDDATTNDPGGDRWKVGWLTKGFWQLKIGSTGNSAGTWTDAVTGVTEDLIGDNNWRALSFASAETGWTAADPTGIAAATAVPEPSIALALAAGLAALARRRKN